MLPKIVMTCHQTVGVHSADSANVTGHGAETAYAAIAAILGPGIPILAWLIVTYSYRHDKQMIIRETCRHVTEDDVGSATTANAVDSLSDLSANRSSDDPLIIDNPLTSQAVHIKVPTATQATAKQIAVRSLRRWDAFLGFRAGRDGLGTPLGVWKPKFDGVRFAVMLLAMRKLNDQLKHARDAGDHLVNCSTAT